MGWLLVNVLVPMLAPLGVYLLFLCLPLPTFVRRRMNPMIALKDGQLCWLGIAYCASGLHEIADKADVQSLGGLLVMFLVLSSLLASGGALFQTSIKIEAGASWVLHFRCFVASLVLTISSAGLFCAAHAYTK